MRWLAWTRERFWLIPLSCSVLAVGLGLSAITLDDVIKHSLQLPFLLSSGVDGARATLSAIAGSMITFTALVFSITIVTLQLTSGQFSRVLLAEERTLDQDVGFGLRQLVDIANRALSPAVNDPTTAVQAVDQLHDLLRRLAVRPLPPLRRTTSDGRLAVVVPTPGFEDYLVLAVDEIARWGSDATRLQNRLRGMLRDLYTAALPEHRAAIARQLLRWHEQPGQTGEPDLTPSDVGLRPSPSWDPELR